VTEADMFAKDLHTVITHQQPVDGLEPEALARRLDHMFGDARMPIWGVAAIISNFLLVVLSMSKQRWFYFASLLMLILFVISYLRLSKPVN
jgi:hypothetical protein